MTTHGSSKKNLKRGLVIIAVAIMGIIGAAPIHAEMLAPQQNVVMRRINYVDVLDTYKSFSTANNPSENINSYDETYRQLAFKTSYARSGQDIIYTSLSLSPKGNGVIGFETKYKCLYSTW